jgi:hypothetical protein
VSERVQFTATRVSRQRVDDPGVTIVGLTDTPAGDSHSLIFQRSATFTDQDRELGQDTFAISTETGATTYGGLQSYLVGDRELLLEFAPDAARDLGLPNTTRVALALSGSELDELRAGLDELIEGGAV